MARSVEEINNYLVSSLVTNAAAIGITITPSLWSKRNLMRLMCYTVAVGQAYMEQLQDLFTQNIEAINARSAAASRLWVQDKMFKFQYSATVPQIVQLINTVPQYPIIDSTLQIIKACSVTTTVSNQVIVKVAKNNPLAKLAAGELSSAQGYLNIIGSAGITYIVTSGDADRLYISADVFFDGQYAATIQADVLLAIRNFMQTLSINNFNGTVKMSDIESAIKGVTGVNDVLLINVRARANTDIFASGTYLILGQQVISRQWQTVSGYITEEDTVGYTFTDSLVFIAE